MASADADLPSQPKYDVFLSFRGPDTRQKFTSHLYEALCRKKIYTYIDDEALDRGDEIGPALLTAIQQSKLSIVIFSKDYASSRWCLDELVHILKCNKEHGLLVVPVFYEIDPSDVRKQQGSYAKSFAILEERFKDNMDQICVWREALSLAADLSGFTFPSQESRHEAEFVETIVNNVLMKLNRNSSYALEKGLVGMESHINQIENLLSICTQDVCFRAIGIWGMGGMGKTALADAVFHLNSSQFDASLFLANVRGESEKHGLNHLRNELLGGLLKEKNLSIGSPSIGLSYIIDRLSRTKVLIVLDDVSDLKQLEFLLGDRVQFGPGSRVIITTRNRRLLKKKVLEDHIYKVNELSVHNALQLFQSIAFDDESSRTDYSDLSRRVVDYVGCIPLALKVLASSFLHCNNNKEDWEEELNKLKKYPNIEVQNVLRYSFDGLEENEKGIFLDIACFFNLESLSCAKRMLEMHGFYASSGIKVLIDMSLISIREGRIQMHDLLQEMGRAIERGFEDLGKRKRCWNAEDAYRVLKTNTGTSTVEAIFLDISKTGQLQLSPNSFRDMHNLSLLKIYGCQEVHEERARVKRRRCFEEKQLMPFSLLPRFNTVQHFLAESRIWSFIRSSALCKSFFVYTGREEVVDDEFERKYLKVYLPGGLESLPHQLKYLYWDSYPLKSLPSKYFPENLVELHMPRSHVRKLWNHVQILGNLKVMDLSDSENLTEVPDLSQSPNIERIYLTGCTSLVEVPSYFENLDKLTDLNLHGCENLKILSEIPCNMVDLDISRTAIEEISPSIWSCKKLRKLYVSGCRDLKHLQSSSSSSSGTCTLNLNGGGEQNLSVLEDVYLSNCTRLESVSDSIYNSKYLVIDSCGMLKRLPPFSSAERLCSLKHLILGKCKELEEIPESLFGLSSLFEIDLSETSIETIPESIINASGLRRLLLKNCTKLQYLPELPSQLEILDASGCTSLKSVASSRTSIIMPRWNGDLGLYFANCLQLDASARSNIMLDAHPRLLQVASASSSLRHEIYSYSFLAVWPGNEIPEWFNNQSEGCSINVKLSPPSSTEEEDQDHFLGFALSSVFTGFYSRDYPPICKLNVKTDDGKSYVHVYRQSIFYFLDDVKTEDHVLVYFVNKLLYHLEEGESIPFPIPIPMNKITEASFNFHPEHHEHVKKCGVRLLYNRDLECEHQRWPPLLSHI